MLSTDIASKGQNNLAFAAYWQLGDSKSAIDLLVNTDRAPEAALLARTYAPRYVFLTSRSLKSILTSSRYSRVPKALGAWRTELENKGKAKTAASLADPARGEEQELFEEGWAEALAREEALGTSESHTNGVNLHA